MQGTIVWIGLCLNDIQVTVLLVFETLEGRLFTIIFLRLLVNVYGEVGRVACVVLYVLTTGTGGGIGGLSGIWPGEQRSDGGAAVTDVSGW